MLGQVWCLIVQILDFCPLSYFARNVKPNETLAKAAVRSKAAVLLLLTFL